MITDLEQILNLAQQEIQKINTLRELENWKIKYLGRKSDLSLFLKSLKNFPLAERKEKGRRANQIRESLLELLKKKERVLKENSFAFDDFFDITQPGKKIPLSHLHPLTLVLNEIVGIFEKLGFQIIEGPDIETEYYNFDALRIPKDHPARDMWDTFWIQSDNPKERLLLKTHTSPFQIRFMETHQPPFRIIAPGRCFRYEATDVSHEIQFHQVEGLMVSEEVSLANFKFIIEEFLKTFFKKKIEIRFRNSYFPFVSPSLEVDIKIKDKKTKSIYKDKWLEIMGAGMVHPELFEEVNYEKNRWQGFAFGLGVERLAMIKYNINDIRLFFSSDLRFLKQF